MVKKFMAGALIAGLALSIIPASAKPKVLKRKNVTFSAISCTVVCPWWVDAGPVVDDPQHADPLDVGLNGIEEGCTDPAPSGTFDDLIVKAPKKAKWLEFEAWPQVDWDIFVCAAPKKGQTSAKYISHSANTAGEADASDDSLCAQTASLAGCYEKVSLSIKGGKRYLLRAFNWGDAVDLPARYTFST